MWRNLALLELDVDGDRIEVVRCEQVEDGMIGSAAPSSTSQPADAFAEAGRHSWHVRRDEVDPTCARCTDRGAQRGSEGRLEPPPEGLRLDQIDSRLSDIDLPPSDSLPPPGPGPLIDLDRPDVAALRTKRWRSLHRDQLELLDRIAADPHIGPDVDAGRAWSAAVIRDAARGTRLLEHLQRAYTALAAPAPPPPPSPEELAVAAARRRDSVMAGYRELVERGEATEAVRSIYERRLAPEQAEGP